MPLQKWVSTLKRRKLVERPSRVVLASQTDASPKKNVDLKDASQPKTTDFGDTSRRESVAEECLEVVSTAEVRPAMGRRNDGLASSGSDAVKRAVIEEKSKPWPYSASARILSTAISTAISRKSETSDFVPLLCHVQRMHPKPLYMGGDYGISTDSPMIYVAIAFELPGG